MLSIRTIVGVVVLAATLAVTGVSAHSHPSVLAQHAHLLQKFRGFPLINPATGAKMSCGTCEILVDVLYVASQSNATRQEIITQLDAACAKEFPNGPQLCDDIVAVVVDELPAITKAISQLGYNDSHSVCSCLSYCTVECCHQGGTVPEQVHINWYGPFSQMSVAWTTLNTTTTSTVRYGTDPSNLEMSQTGTQWTYTRGGWLGTLHQAVMIGLVANTTYYYQVGDPTDGWSALVYQFNTLPESPTSLRFVTIGDMGSDHSDDTIANLIATVEAGEVDAIIHNGDISYADGNEQNWDIFFRKVERAASRVPYMTTAGNHELWWDFTAYKARLGQIMPYQQSASTNPLYYSFTIGNLVHFVGFNTETAIDTADVDPTQIAWLKQDLSSAAATNARWRIGYAHRPMYCANNEKEQCTDFPAILQEQTEDVFQTYDIPLVLTAHEHNYQRTYPVYKGIVQNNGSYVDPHAPTYLVNGAGGNREGETNGWKNPMPEWMAFHETPTGLGRLTVSYAALQFEFISNANGVVDSFQITKP